MINGLDQGRFQLGARDNRRDDGACNHHEFQEAAHVTHIHYQALMLQLMQAADVVRQKEHLSQLLIVLAGLRVLPLVLQLEKGVRVVCL